MIVGSSVQNLEAPIKKPITLLHQSNSDKRLHEESTACENTRKIERLVYIT